MLAGARQSRAPASIKRECGRYSKAKGAAAIYWCKTEHAHYLKKIIVLVPGQAGC